MSEEITVQESMHDKASEIITSGKISSAVWFVAWPTVINTLILTAYQIINRYFIGRARGNTTDMLAALTVAFVPIMIQQAVLFGVTTGASALSSRFLGAKEINDAQEATGQSIVLCAIAAIVTAIPIWAFARPLVLISGGQGNVIPLATAYLKIIALFGSVQMFLRMTIQTALRSTGDTKSPLYAGVVVIGVNILLDWLLIWGVGPFPCLGVRGAAIATVVSQSLGMIVVLIFLEKSILGGALKHLKPHPVWFGRILKIGAPAIVQNGLWSFGTGGFIRILSIIPGATNAQAALSTAWPIEMLAFMPGVAYSIAAAPLVGQNLGAGKPKRAEHSAWVATGHAMAIMSAVAACFIAIPATFAHISTRNPAVVKNVVWYLRINGPAEPFLALAMVLTGALQGAGDTLVPMLIEGVSSILVRLTFAWLLAVRLGWGVPGAWTAMASSTVLYGILVAAWFRRGSWKHRKV